LCARPQLDAGARPSSARLGKIRLTVAVTRGARGPRRLAASRRGEQFDPAVDASAHLGPEPPDAGEAGDVAGQRGLLQGAGVAKHGGRRVGDVLWGDLDYLFIDLPPGTGDTQISLVQNASVDGAIVVSTPQDVAFLDARKAIGLFQTVKVPIIGVVENMSSFHCPNCHMETQIFGHGGVKAAAKRMDLPFLGEVPIDLEIRVGGDSGVPLVAAHPNSPQSKSFMAMARSLAANYKML